FGKVQLKRSEAVGEVERVDDGCRLVRERIGLDDIHAPSGENAGQLGEKERTISGDQRQFIPVAAAFQLDLHRIAAQFLGHLQVAHDLFGGVHQQVSLGESFDESFEI